MVHQEFQFYNFDDFLCSFPSATEVEDNANNVLVRESLVTNFFKIFLSLIPGSDLSDFSTLVTMKNDFVDKYSKHQFRKVVERVNQEKEIHQFHFQTK